MSASDPLNPPPRGTNCDLCRLSWHVRKLAEVKLPWWDEETMRRRGRNVWLICPSCWKEILLNWERKEEI